MRQPGQLFFLRLLLLLCLPKIIPAAVCLNNCSSINVNTTSTEIIVTSSGNFTISNITFANGTQFLNSSLNNSSVSGLFPGVQYSVYFSNGTDECCKNITTKPSAVGGLNATNVSTENITLTWENRDLQASNYTYRILYGIKGNSSLKNTTSENKSATITGLQPGTLYEIKVFAQVAGIEGESIPIDIRTNQTEPSAVDLKAVNISAENITLTWKSGDLQASNYTYRIFYGIKGNSSLKNTTSRNNSVTITGLQPGTLHEIKVFAQIEEIEGESTTIEIYTKPSVVGGLNATNVSTENITLTWENRDLHASNYTYTILYGIKGNSSLANTTSENKSANITGLQPGTLYEIKVFARIAEIEGESATIDIRTKPSAVGGLNATNVSTENITLTWENRDLQASNYTYRILYGIKGNSSLANTTSENKSATITGLQPGTLYEIKVFAQVAGIEGESTPIGTCTRNLYTSLTDTPTFQLTAINGRMDVKLSTMLSDSHSNDWGRRVQAQEGCSEQLIEVLERVRDMGSGKTSYTKFCSSSGSDWGTESRSVKLKLYNTGPSAVVDLKVANVSTESITLTWENRDLHSSNYTYTILYGSKRNSSRENTTSSNKSATITGLQPGTLYEIKVFAQVAGIEGESTPIGTCTKPSPVFHLQVVNISTTEVNLSWQNNDANASNYLYVVISEENGSQTNTSKSYPLTELNPGTSYTFTVFPQLQCNETEGDRISITNCTVAASVSQFSCTPVAKQSVLALRWSSPNGSYTSFKINTVNAVWRNETPFLTSNLSTTITNLNYSTTYSVSIITCSCGKESLPVQKTCDTSITDPPSPDEKPGVTSVSYNSFKIKFGGFESKNGPLIAYALVITTDNEGNKPTNSSLKYTYKDFKDKKTNIYITYIINATQMRIVSSRLDSSQYEVEVGNSRTSYGYYNAPLEPLGSYWASVAGFTKIELSNNSGGIIEERSYVSFTDFSDKISLPQNPDVITGAVVGCILGAVAISAVVGFIFWRRRRKDGQNSELPFSPIKPKKSKSVKVENFESYFKKQQADSSCGFAEEYEELRSVGINQPKFTAELPENRGKNRYNNVLPYEISRVKLSIHTHTTDDFINANYMPGYNSKKEFIAAQGPLPNTIEDFWRMIWEKNIYVIVMLTKCVEQGRTKCEEYWPDKGYKYYGDITVTLISEFVLPEWTIRDFTMEVNNATESHTVRQFHFTSWPDHGVPETTDLLINFRHLVKENMMRYPPESPTLVHCSAGVGRTGTFIAIDRLIQQMELEHMIDVYGVVYDLRMHRPLMVQTEDQYIFLNQCVLDIIKSQSDKKSDLIYQNTTAMAIYENITPAPNFEKANGYHT
uniref:Receptor-type tyrosine-protein phosphatase eta n=1 Tax=Pelodiscus sinensis TaxID=13735 RepID=K7F4E6_PELSI